MGFGTPLGARRPPGLVRARVASRRGPVGRANPPFSSIPAPAGQLEPPCRGHRHRWENVRRRGRASRRSPNPGRLDHAQPLAKPNPPGRGSTRGEWYVRARALVDTYNLVNYSASERVIVR